MFIRAVRKQDDDWEKSGAYLRNIPAVSGLTELDLDTPVSFFVGENGSGKSTLLESIAVLCGFNPEGGGRNFSFSTKDTHSPLYRHLKLVKGISLPKDGYFLRAESFYNLASEVDRLDKDPLAGPLIPSYGGVSLHEQSHGESFFALMNERFFGNGLYLLDEPEAALSPMRQLSMLVRMKELIGQNSQFIIATHSPILMAYPGARIFLLDEPNGIRQVAYTDTPHYQVTKDFLDCPQRMLRELFRIK